MGSILRLQVANSGYSMELKKKQTPLKSDLQQSKMKKNK